MPKFTVSNIKVEGVKAEHVIIGSAYGSAGMLQAMGVHEPYVMCIAYLSIPAAHVLHYCMSRRAR